MGDDTTRMITDALQKLGDSPAARMIVVPTDFSNFAGALGAITEMMNKKD